MRWRATHEGAVAAPARRSHSTESTASSAVAVHPPGYGFGLIEARGGRVHSGPSVDTMLRGLGARAATRGSDVYMRSDLAANPSSPKAQLAYAHEAVHLLQQRGLRGAEPGHAGESGAPGHAGASDAEREADFGARVILAGGEPLIRHREAAPVLRTQLDANEFEPGMAEMMTLDRARKNPHWCEKDILNYGLSEKPPWTFTILYKDGSTLVIPLTAMSNRPLAGATMTMFRYHAASGRLVPFQVPRDAADLEKPGMKGLPWMQALEKIMTPRFDPALTPYIMSYLDQAQMLFLGTGMLKVLQLQLMNPVRFGPFGGAGSAGGGGIRLAPRVRVAAGAGGGVLSRAGTVTVEAAVKQGLIREGGKLHQVLKGIQELFVAKPPSSMMGGMEVVGNATRAVGLETGTVAAGGVAAESITLANVGGVMTTILRSGEILVTRGGETLLRLIP